MEHETFHLTAERIQALLDGQLPPGEAVRTREHVDTCARCRSEVEAWEALFGELCELPELAPSAGFQERVMAAAPAARALPWAARVRGWLGLAPVYGPDMHPRGIDLQDLLDGTLGRRRAAAVDGHVRVCSTCRHEVEALAGVVTALERLPLHAPAEGFADRVMERVRVPEPAPVLARLGHRALARVREVLSLRTRRAWAAVAGVALTPTLITAMVAWVVFSHPLVTVSGLGYFLWLQGSHLAAAALQWGAAAATGSPLLFRAWQALKGLSVAPSTAATAFVVFSALTVMAVWVLYRNLFTAHVSEGRYAKLQA